MRSTIPAWQSGDRITWATPSIFALADSVSSNRNAETTAYYKHIGCTFIGAIFCWRIRIFPPGPSKQAECLEQLRALENGFGFGVVETEI